MTMQHPLRNLVWFVTGVALTAAILALGSSWRADAAVAGESTYVPIAPCRLMDLRAGEFNIGPRDTPLSSKEAYVQQVTGTNGECSLPSTATAVALNVTALEGTAPSFLTLYPGGTPPTASNLNWLPGQPPTPNKVDVKLSASGEVSMYNENGLVNVIIDVAGYYTDSTIADLESRLAAVEAKLASMSVETIDGQPTVRFTGVNVQVVDGSGFNSALVTGRGNLIVGYSANGGDEDRTGSHNLVVGDFHSYSSFGGLIAGFDNNITGAGIYSTVAGGSGNVASRNHSAVLGGFDNTVTGFGSVVAGGEENTAQGESSVVTGGRSNTATDTSSVIVGGFANSAGENDVTVGGDNRRCDAGGTNAYVCGEGAWLPFD